MADTTGTSAPNPNPAATTIKNSFSGANTTFANMSLHTLVASILRFRKQLTLMPDRMQPTGWGDEANVYMKQNLIDLRKHVTRITYNTPNMQDTKLGQGQQSDPVNVTLAAPSPGVPSQDQQQLLEKTVDPTNTLQTQFDNAAPTSDSVLSAAAPNRTIIQDLSGTDLNVPQLDNTNCQNDHFRAFVVGLDNFLVAATRLSSRYDPDSISKFESRQLNDILSKLWTICIVFGGEANKVDSPNGTLPDDEGSTFQAGPIQNVGAKAAVTGG